VPLGYFFEIQTKRKGSKRAERELFFFAKGTKELSGQHPAEARGV
jgi:hypothetical protein